MVTLESKDERQGPSEKLKGGERSIVTSVRGEITNEDISFLLLIELVDGIRKQTTGDRFFFYFLFFYSISALNIWQSKHGLIVEAYITLM